MVYKNVHMKIGGCSMHAEREDKREKLRIEAVEEGTTPERIREHGARPHVHASGEARQELPASGRLVDGYAQTEGGDYPQPQRDEREGYDPTHSGVRHAPNKPGAPTSAPGREEGTAWGEQRENGKTTDIPARKNPAD
jgi:hypothetical protein